MKPYGLKSKHPVESPDVGDIKAFALQSSTGCLKKKSGDYRGYHKNKDAKRRTRRFFKKRERRLAKEWIDKNF